MAYRVEISLPALADAEDTYLWIKYHAPAAAVNGMKACWQQSSRWKTLRCVVRARLKAPMSLAVRQLLYGKRNQQYRILFDLEPDPATGEEVVRIYRIWHSARRKASAEEIGEGRMRKEPLP